MDQKSAFSSQTVLALVVMAIAAVCRHFKFGVSDATINDVAYLLIQLGCSVWAFIGAARAHASPATPLSVFGLVMQLAPQAQKVAEECVFDTQQAPASTSPPGLTNATPEATTAVPTEVATTPTTLTGGVAATALLLVFGLGLTCCAGKSTGTDFVTDSYRALSAAGITYDAAMKSAAEAYQSGHITEAQKTEIVRYGNAFAGAYHLAVVALEECVTAGASNASAQTKAVQALADVAGRLGELKTYAEPILGAIQGGK